MPARYAYSLNGENYTGAFATREEATSSAFVAARDHYMQPQTIFVGRRVEADPHASGHARTILREMAWQAHDEVGSSATGYLHQLNDDQVQDLDSAVEMTILDWLRRQNLLPAYFKVEGISEHPVPAPASIQSQSGDGNEVHQVGDTQFAPQM